MSYLRRDIYSLRPLFATSSSYSSVPARLEPVPSSAGEGEKEVSSAMVSIVPSTTIAYVSRRRTGRAVAPMTIARGATSAAHLMIRPALGESDAIGAQRQTINCSSVARDE